MGSLAAFQLPYLLLLHCIYIYIYIYIYSYSYIHVWTLLIFVLTTNHATILIVNLEKTRGLWQGFLDTRATEVVLVEMRPPTMWWSCKHRLLSCSVLTNKEHVVLGLLPVARVVMIGRLVRKFYKAFTWWLDIWDQKIYLRQRHLHILNVNLYLRCLPVIKTWQWRIHVISCIGCFPIAMLDYQRVNIYIINTYLYLFISYYSHWDPTAVKLPTRPWWKCFRRWFCICRPTTIRSTLDKARCKTSFFPPWFFPW